jgi:6-phosphogluconate dehydrogenase
MQGIYEREHRLIAPSAHHHADSCRQDLKPIFQSICAQVDGEACCDWVGDEGAGHYVKMVHNGIEYGDMQLCCEAYHLLKVSDLSTVAL